MKNTKTAEKTATKTTKKATATKTATAPKKLTPAEIGRAAGDILTEYATTSAIREHSAALLEKYGRSAWASIWAEIKHRRAEVIRAAGGAVRAEMLSYSSAIESEYNRAKSAPRWRDFLAALRGQYATGAAFIAANYPDTIAGQPARRVYYIAPNGLTIAAAFEVAPRDGRRATADVIAALTAAERDAVRTSNAGTDTAIKATRARVAGEVVGAWNVKTEDGRAVRGDELSADIVAKYRAAGLVGWSPLAEYNREK